MQIPVNGIVIIFYYLKYQKCKVYSLFFTKIKNYVQYLVDLQKKTKLQWNYFIHGLFSSLRLYDASASIQMIGPLNSFIDGKVYSQ